MLKYIYNQRRAAPRRFYSDNAPEFDAKPAYQTYIVLGIRRTTNAPHTPQENSLSERVNHTLLDAIHAALSHAGLPDEHWEDALHNVCYKYNMMPHTATGKIPPEKWAKTFKPPKTMHPFGQWGTYHDTSPKTKLERKSIAVRYIYELDDVYMVFLEPATYRYHSIRHADFHAYDPQKDPTLSQNTLRKPTPATAQATTMSTQKRQAHVTPSHISVDTLPPVTISYAKNTRTLQSGAQPTTQNWTNSMPEEP